MQTRRTTAGDPLPPSQRTLVRASLLLLLVLLLATYLLRFDDVCGLLWDDAWYVLLARALATGHGYTLTNTPTPGLVPFYPPGFPLLLSLVFRIAPDFPDNVVLLKAVSLLAMAGVALLAIHHARRDQRLPFVIAWTIGVATALHPAFVFLATSTVMSECVFTLAQLGSVVAVERALRAGGGTAAARRALAAGLLAGFTFLTRGAGIALLIACLVRLVWRRAWAAGLAFTLAAGAVAAPWVLYARAHAPTPTLQAEANDAVTVGYGTHFWHRVAGHPELGTVTASDLRGRIAGNLWQIARSSMGALHVYFPFRSVEPAAWRIAPGWGHAVALAFTAVVALGFAATLRERVTAAELLVPLSLLVTVAWPFPPTRFVLPLLPFVLCYTARGLALLARPLTRRDVSPFALAVLGGLAVVSVVTNALYAASLHGPAPRRPRWNQVFAEERALLDWLKTHVPGGQVIATDHPAQVHLYAGFQTVGYYDASGAFEQWRRLGVHFFARAAFQPRRDPTLARFGPVFRTPVFGMRVLDLSPLYDRPPGPG